SPTGVPSLQDDYHKLLTKYAEAENTIDQLRLGARVSLFSDPPQPSRSLAVGTVGTGCRVMTLSIPQARMAALGTATATASPSPAGGRLIRVSPPAAGPSDRGGSLRPRSPPPPAGGCPSCPGPCCCPGPRLTRALAGQSRRLQAQARPGGAAGGAAGMRLLKDAQDALEREYLRGRQQLPGAAGAFDPDRAVEEEIYRLGLRLEGLKERLEAGGRRQPPLHPALVEGPLGTAGDNEGAMGALPWPLWHKHLRVEEDFGDLLEQYKHFKSLPESLSLEQLSLAGSGSQEEVDAPAAGDGGPGKVPCRTRSLEEGADLETLPLHPPERKAALLPSRGPAKAEGTRGHPSPATSEEPPATAKPHLVAPGPPRAPLSRRSSGTGSAAPQRGPRKVNPLGTPHLPPLPAPPGPAGGPGVLSSDPAVPVPLQEQRIVSPETDSGFVGSEASRVSPPVRTPEHRPPGAGYGPQPLPLPSGAQGHGLSALSAGKRRGAGMGGEASRTTPSQGSSPPRWAESVGSEAGPDAGGDGGEPDPQPRQAPGLVLGSLTAAGCWWWGSGRCGRMVLILPRGPQPRWGRWWLQPRLSVASVPHSQAIRELQQEVWRLRRRLEESLRRSRSYPEGKATPRVAPARRQPVGSAPSSPRDAAPSG
ncbi:AKNA factor, partial [Oxyruncus cristatus]|nr:AKNA factor [Oxyruncus cristatus]